MNKETLKQILAAMKLHTAETHPLVETERAMELIETELAKPEQEPAAWYDKHGAVTHDPFDGVIPLYTSSPQRQPLTTDEYVQALGPLLNQIVCSSGTLRCIVRTIEAKHGIKEQP